VCLRPFSGKASWLWVCKRGRDEGGSATLRADPTLSGKFRVSCDDRAAVHAECVRESARAGQRIAWAPAAVGNFAR
jgi:hypothetical protein